MRGGRGTAHAAICRAHRARNRRRTHFERISGVEVRAAARPCTACGTPGTRAWFSRGARAHAPGPDAQRAFALHCSTCGSRAPRHGAYNLHPGPLPEYAGLNAPSWAIYHGEPCHGVTLHRMEPGVDTGPIAFQTRFALSPRDTGLSVSLRCAEEGLRLVERLLDADPSRVRLEPQDLSARRYFGRGVPQDGRIDWTLSAQRVQAFVRACDYRPFPSPWDFPMAEVGERMVKVLKTALTGTACGTPPGTVDYDPAGRARVACEDEWLELVRTQPALTPPAPGRASASRARPSGSGASARRA